MDCPNENTLSAFADGRLPRAEADAIEAHARICESCPARIAAAVSLASGSVTSTVAHTSGAQVRPRENATPHGAAAPAVDDAELERGASIGRYTLLGVVGRGGTGEVYAAYDPELDRKIALKLLRARSADRRSQVRLLREAKAIAKLSHANVIVVHDAGTFEERVFVAMEFVDGQTLKEWLRAAPRTRQQILEVFGAAARGLQAAHAAGLVHRDFKPHNVMVGKEGGVRVMDFGLAREVDAHEDADEAVAEAPVTPDDADDAAFTRTGELVGTPLYMAPEQFMATRTDARTDQFAFCVALYQALYGAHPFGGPSIDVLVTRVLAGEVQPPPAKHDVPTWLRRVLVRGLSVAPAARWPSMAALIEALEQDPARARRRWGVVAGVALLVVAATVTLVRGPRRAESLCRGGPARLAGVWEPAGPPGTARPRRDALAATFQRAGGVETWARVEPLLDRYAADWLAMYRDACEATHARGEQSPETLDLRMDCLDERRGALGALTTVLASASAAAVSSSVNAVNALPALDRCADVRLLREGTDAPRDEATRARIADVRARLATAKALNDTGQHDEAERRGEALIAEARTLGNRSLLAETLGTVAWFESGSHFQPRVAPMLEESVWTALSVKRDDIAAQSSALLEAVYGYYLARRDEGRRWSRLALALLDRMGPGHDVLRSWVAAGEGSMKLQENDVTGALERFQTSLALKEKALAPDHPDVALGIDNVAEATFQLGRIDEALALNKRAGDLVARAYGPSAPEVARIHNNRGEYLLAAGRASEALGAYTDALGHWGGIGEPESSTLGYPLTGLGESLLRLGRPAEAIEPLEHALRLRDLPVPDALQLAETRFALARALSSSGASGPRARTLAEQARDAYAHVSDSAHTKTIDAWLAARPAPHK